jgi:undecaprenyl diphosphate synthase
MTKDNDDLTLLIAFNYGFSEEILTCVKKITHKCLNNELTISDINNELIENNLYTSGVPNVDLLIRTSGEQRLSNFLLLQCSYAELYFTEVYWPDFKEQEYLAALNEYQKRQRRFGGL